MLPHRMAIINGGIIIAGLVAVGCGGSQENSVSEPERERTNPTPTQPAATLNPLLKAIRERGNLKAALESLNADAIFDAENNLVSLALDEVAVSDDAMKVIGQQTKLRSLFLYNTQVTDAGLKHLTDLTELRILYLAGTAVTDVGAAELEQALPNCVIRR